MGIWGTEFRGELRREAAASAICTEKQDVISELVFCKREMRDAAQSWMEPRSAAALSLGATAASFAPFVDALESALR